MSVVSWYVSRIVEEGEAGDHVPCTSRSVCRLEYLNGFVVLYNERLEGTTQQWMISEWNSRRGRVREATDTGGVVGDVLAEDVVDDGCALLLGPPVRRQ